MGSFWGLSDAGKEAEGWPREYGAWGKDQFKQMLAQAGIFGQDADRLTAQMEGYWQNQVQNGGPSIGDTRNAGRDISPWVDQYANDSRTRLESEWGLEQGRTKAGDVAADIQAGYDSMKTRNEGNKADLENEIADTAARGMGREQSLYDDSTAQILKTGGALRDNINAGFGGLRADNAATYAGIKDRGAKTFADQLKDLGLIAPGGQANAARAARAFAGQMADVMTRLRRSGIDPNAPEAASQLRAVETARSRAIDDALGESARGYLDRKTAITGNELGFMTDADKARLQNEIGLGTGQTDRISGVIGDESDQLLKARAGLTSGQNRIDENRSQQRQGVVDTTFQREQELSEKGNKLKEWLRTADMEDRDRLAEVMQKFSANDLIVGGLLDQQYKQGNEQLMQDLLLKNNAANQLGNMGKDARENQYRSQNAAKTWGDTAMNAYGTAYGYEAPKAGYGMKLLGAAGGALLGGAFGNPMLGMSIGNAVGGAAAQPGGTPMPAATPGFNPNASTPYNPGYGQQQTGNASPWASAIPNLMSMMFKKKPGASSYNDYAFAGA